MTPEDFDPGFLDDVYALFAEYVSMEVFEQIMQEAMYEAVRASISGATQAEVLEVAASRAASLVTRVSDEMRMQLADKIATGLEQQLGPEGTARLLREGLGLDSNREKQLENYQQSLIDRGITGDKLERMVEAERDALINERARTIAQNEMGQALEEGAFNSAAKGGDTHKVWITSGDGKVSDICIENQAAGVIPIGDAFPSGDMHPQAHVSCRCSVGYLADPMAIDIARDLAAEEKARLEEIQAAKEREKENA